MPKSGGLDVQTLCLGVLTQGDHSGYEIKKHFEEVFAYFYGAGYGSIYPALARLTESGLVRCTEVSQAGKPDKKVYSITDEGLEQFVSTLAAAEPNHRIRSEFMVQMCFAHLLPPARLEEILAERIRRFEQMMLMAECPDEENCEHALSTELTVGYARAVIGAAITFLKDEAPRIVREHGHPQTASEDIEPATQAAAAAS